MKKNVPEEPLPSGILPLGSNQLPLGLQFLRHTGPNMDNEQETRIAVLKQIRDTEFDGVQARMAAKLEVQPDYLSRVLKGGKGLSGDTARLWEERLNKPRYYLDGVTSKEAAKLVPATHTVEQLDALADQASELIALFLKLAPDARRMILHSTREAASSSGKVISRRGRNKP